MEGTDWFVPSLSVSARNWRHRIRLEFEIRFLISSLFSSDHRHIYDWDTNIGEWMIKKQSGQTEEGENKLKEKLEDFRRMKIKLPKCVDSAHLALKYKAICYEDLEKLVSHTLQIPYCWQCIYLLSMNFWCMCVCLAPSFIILYTYQYNEVFIWKQPDLMFRLGYLNEQSINPYWVIQCRIQVL